MLQTTDPIKDIYFVVDSAPLVLQGVADGLKLLEVYISAISCPQGLLVRLFFRQNTLYCLLLAHYKLLSLHILLLKSLVLQHSWTI